MSYPRERPPPSLNGWGSTIDREVTSIRREMDHMAESASDREDRIRRLEASAISTARDIQRLDSLDMRISVLEKSLRAVVWAMAVLCWKLAPDIAANLLALLPVRIG